MLNKSEENEAILKDSILLQAKTMRTMLAALFGKKAITEEIYGEALDNLVASSYFLQAIPSSFLSQEEAQILA